MQRRGRDVGRKYVYMKESWIVRGVLDGNPYTAVNSLSRSSTYAAGSCLGVLVRACFLLIFEAAAYKGERVESPDVHDGLHILGPPLPTPTSPVLYTSFPTPSPLLHLPPLQLPLPHFTTELSISQNSSADVKLS